MNLQPYTDEEYDEIIDKGLDGKMLFGHSSFGGTTSSNDNDTDENTNFLPPHAKSNPSLQPNGSTNSSTSFNYLLSPGATNTSSHQSSAPPNPVTQSLGQSGTQHVAPSASLQQPSTQQGSMTPMPMRNQYGFSARHQPRSSDYESDRVAISRNRRGATDKERNKSRELSTAAITPSIKRSNITKILNSNSSSSYDISEDATQWQMTLVNIHRHAVASDFKHIIMIPKHFDEKNPNWMSNTGIEYVNAILDHDKLRPDHYSRWQYFLRNWGNQEEVTSDQWFEEKLVKSLDPALLKEVMSEFNGLEEDEKGSITFLCIIIDRIVQSNQEARRAMEDYIKSFDIRRFSGEDVTEACLRIKAIAQSIGTNQLPSDIIHRVLEGFAYASTPAFQNFCHTQESVISSSLFCNQLSSTTLYQQLVNVLNDLEVRYTDLRSGQRWLGYGHGTSTIDSTFLVSSNTTNHLDGDELTDTEYNVYLNTVGRGKALPYDIWVRDKTCHHCGEVGHVRPRCPHRDQASTQRSGGRQQYRPPSKAGTTGGKRFETSPAVGTRSSSQHLSKSSSNDKKDYIKRVLTAVMDMVDSDDTPSHDDDDEQQVEEDSPPPALSSPKISESKYSAFLAALGCPKE